MRIQSLVLMILLLNFNANAEEVMYENGYIQLPKHMQKEINVDSKSIMFFFDFNCIYCKALHPYMTTWGDTLPVDLQFKFVPIVINDPMYLLNASAWKFISESKLAIALKYKYMHYIYEYLPKVSDHRQLARLIKESMFDIGADMNEFAEKYSDGFYNEFLTNQLKLQKTINLEVTPSVLIGGKLLTHLGLSKGEVKDFIPLLNAVTSFYIYQERDEDE